MRFSLLSPLLIALFSQALAATECSAPVVLDATTNIWKGRSLHATSTYRSKVEQAVTAFEDVSLKTQASRVADFGTFTWIQTQDDITSIQYIANETRCNDIVGLVLDALPYKEARDLLIYDPYSTAVYQAFYIDPLVDAIRSAPRTAFTIIIEPAAFPRFFNATSGVIHGLALVRSYRENIRYALKALNLPNVVMYLDVGHAYSLDWVQHGNAAADAVVSVYNASGRPAQLRGFATNVANFNAWDQSPGEFARADDSRDPRPVNEQHFVRVFSDALKKSGLPASSAHAIMDTSRNAVQGLRYSWDDWCNVGGAGIGRRPTGETKDERLDAFVWVKRPGESDGTNNSASEDYNPFCGNQDAFKPSPAKGQWNQKYFEMLVENAKPSL